MKVLVSQFCPTLCDPMDHSQPDSSVHGIFQARILDWVAISCSRASSWPRDWTQASLIEGKFFTIWAIRKTLYQNLHSKNKRLFLLRKQSMRDNPWAISSIWILDSRGGLLVLICLGRMDWRNTDILANINAGIWPSPNRSCFYSSVLFTYGSVNSCGIFVNV